MFQNTQEVNWALEIAKIVSPIISALVLGLWLNSRNEKIKAELQLKFYDSQVKTDEKKLHLAKLEELYERLCDMQKNNLAYITKIDEYAKLPYSSQLSNELTRFLAGDLIRIETLLEFYTSGLSNDLNNVYEELSRLNKIGDKILKNSKNGVISEAYRRQLSVVYEQSIDSYVKLMEKVLEQSRSYKHLNFNHVDKAS